LQKTSKQEPETPKERGVQKPKTASQFFGFFIKRLTLLLSVSPIITVSFAYVWFLTVSSFARSNDKITGDAMLDRQCKGTVSEGIKTKKEQPLLIALSSFTELRGPDSN